MDLGPEFAILVVTPVMKRAHKLVSASEIVFVDSTASVESGKSTLTIILIGTKAGAIPIGVFMHEKQTALNYEKAFRLLQNKYPKCFGGKEVNMF